MAKTKAEMMAERMRKQNIGQQAFETGAKSIRELPAPDAAEPSGGDLSAYACPTGTQGRKGQKTPRMNLAIPRDVYEYIRRESRKQGMTYSEFICAVMRQRKMKGEG